MSVTVSIADIHCSSCEQTIVDALESLEDVTSALADAESGIATAEGDIATEAVITAVEDAGYDVVE